MITIREVTAHLEDFAPLAYQEEYDNSGLIIGNGNHEVQGILICLDTTEKVIEEAIGLGCNLIISHHPIIFKGLKKITGSDHVERTVLKAIQNNIAIYAVHTNLDNVIGGVNARICDKLNLTKRKILSPKHSTLSKLVTFVPAKNKDQVLQALFDAGVGQIGNYKHCSFSVDGTGTFRPGEDTDPFVGETGKDETVSEKRIEVIFPAHLWNSVYDALKSVHPYEEVAYYHTRLDNNNQEVGSGMTGLLPEPMNPVDFLNFLKKNLNLEIVRHTTHAQIKEISKVAVCGGSGSFLISDAIRSGAEVFVTGDVKYHDFFNAEHHLMIADIGHYESEIFTKDLLYDLLMKKFNTFALHLSKTDSNPVSYF